MRLVILNLPLVVNPLRNTVTRGRPSVRHIFPTVANTYRFLWLLATDSHVSVTLALVQLGLTRKSEPVLGSNTLLETSADGQHVHRAAVFKGKGPD
ncbi:hypothetical protein AVEN_119851-1 [Araneus ventricosus]|uniref:Uncharacterized protein n=1 Tax=Araneus ventricosus TaxID=182803 RepID=A0A4Y2GJV3_ARAVE|nr:hypothetical protein AVEN_119851-1 [Araneus ventricosus]